MLKFTPNVICIFALYKREKNVDDVMICFRQYITIYEYKKKREKIISSLTQSRGILSFIILQ